MREALLRYFQIERRGSTIGREVLGGLATFLTMAYIVVVNPAILSAAGLPAGASTTATIVVAIAGTLLMALWANRPIAIAPYMGENAFIAFTVVGALGYTWQQALAAVFLGGLIFVATTAFGWRGRLANALPTSLKHAFAAGIGLFLAFIGLYESGIVTSGAAGMPAAALTGADGLLRAPAVPVKLGAIGDPGVLIAIAGIAMTAILIARRVPGAILVGIALTGVAGFALGLAPAPTGIVALPFTGEYSLAPIAFALDLSGALEPSFLPVLLTIFLMGFLDTIGTLIGVGAQGDMLDERGHFPDIEKPMMADAVASTLAGLVGTTTAGAYIESATGVREGARTGLASVVTALCFALALPLAPLLAPVQALSFAYGPPLVVVGVLMLRSIVHIDFEDLTETLPAAATLLVIVLTYNIANGLTAGLVLYPVMKIASGRAREVTAPVAVLALLSAVYYAFGLTH